MSKQRAARAAAVYAALGVLWWATARIGWTAVGCEAWNCLPPALGTLLVITVGTFALSAVVLNRVEVRPGFRVAFVTAAMLVVFRLAGEMLPSSSSRFTHVVMSAVAFAMAGAVAAFATDTEIAKRRRLPVSLGVPALVFVAIAVSWWWRGL
ncbi:hypothetical protein ACIBO2_11875 [Nonomuraea sp. NPDC050022]|uniref:hypothetical protein n=1 Tax=Nonomuraea sp. NPDC050022 TaxID=3364358 RepID=UPI0037A77001